MHYSVDTKELKKAMIDADMDTIQDLTDKSGINRNTIAGVLNGKIYPSSDVMQRMALALNLNYIRAGKIFFAPQLAFDASSEMGATYENR